MEKARINNKSLMATSPEELITSLASQMSDMDQDLTSKSGEVVQAMVLDAVAYLHSYFITAPNRKPTMAFMSSDSPLLPIGSRGHASLMPGSTAIAWYPGGGETDWAVILGARNPIMLDRNLILPPYLVPASRIGLFDDISQSLLVELPSRRKQIANASAGRPIDTISGEWGYTNELGLALHMGKLMAFMKASETAGIYVYHLDDLVRLWSYNFEHFTAGSERYAYDDEGEFTDRIGSTPYPWEALGSFGPLVAAASAAQTKETGEGKKGVEELWVEPKYRDQAPIWRRQQFNGFLGGMDRDIIQVPSLPWVADDPEQYSRMAAYPGLLDIHKGLDGRYSVRSAKEITFEKVILIPVPKQMKQPADPDGDFRDNFSASGRKWTRTQDGDTYTTPDPGVLEEFNFDLAPGGKFAELLDYHTYMTKVYGVQGFRLHPKDWLLPDEVSSGSAPSVASAFTPAVDTELAVSGTPINATDYFLDMPQMFSLRIDHRTQVVYYASRSVIKQFDDGSILIEDGWGAQLKMGHGHATLTAPLDVLNQAGRSIVSMAGSDVIERAGNSVDITAAKRDVRIKSERNLQMLSGNSGEGNMLLESRATGSPSIGVGEDMGGGGIVIKGLNTGLTLDAKQMNLITTEDLVLSAATLRMLGLMALTGDSIMNGKLTIDEIDAKKLNAQDISTAASLKTVVGGAPPHTHDIAFVSVDDPTVEEQNNTDAAAAAAAEESNTGFSLRTGEQYQLVSGSFIWFEHRWQQYFRRDSTGKKVWDEPVVSGPDGVETQPYPGRALWNTDEAYREVALQLFDIATGMPKGYTDIGDDTASGEAVPKRLSQAYLIASQGQE